MAVFHSCDSDGIVSQMRSNRAFTFALTNFSWLHNGVKKTLTETSQQLAVQFLHVGVTTHNTQLTSHMCVSMPAACTKRCGLG